ncbi:MAG: aminotransferase class V-fold PLP-dependent enzyme, partial [Deltaproteobacteria bacterium]|nr:aminotransferase class V-fold PLP-dependent enzyme [Deltaproteobacteria bacterium]
MLPYFTQDFGNAASHSHVFGWRAEAAVTLARERVARAIGARSAGEIVFTSGATESINLALKGVVQASGKTRNHLIAVATEHPAVLDTARALEASGCALDVLPVDAQGLLDPDAVRRAIGPRTLLVSVMAANNEIGVLQPLAEIGAVCRERGVLLHCDAAQAAGKIPLDVSADHVDLLSLSGHKVYAPKGVGALYVRSRPRLRLAPQIHGGGHERGLRSGTLAVPLVVGLGRAIEIACEEREAEAARLAALRARLLSCLEGEVGGVSVNGHPELRLPGNLNVSFDGIDAAALLVALPGIALSTGSACASAQPHPSHVLAALGLSDARIRSAVRIGIGRFTSGDEIDEAAAQIVRAVRSLRALSTPGTRPGYPRAR